jgi:hypothetical protein
MADDDPFAVFGAEDEDEQDVNTSSTPCWAGQQLVEQTNQRMSLKMKNNGAAAETIVDTKTPKEDPVRLPDKLVLWPDSPPLYLGPIQLVSCLPVGGGRGFVATRDLAPGTLVLVEEPVMEWSDAQIGKALNLVSVEQLLQHENAQNIIHDMEDFHPTKEAVDQESGDETQIEKMMQELLAQYQDDNRLDEFVQLSKQKHFTCRNKSMLNARDVVRLLLALRYNGLTSGVYRHVAMLNHDCHPNCVKFMPTTSGYSEVRTTRHVNRGESLTISYLPRVVSHATRRRLLWEQHRFDIGVESRGEWRAMDFIGNSLPFSSIEQLDESSATFRIETATSQLEEHFQEAVVSLDAMNPENPAWNEIKALEAASLELYTESKNQLRNDHHLLLIPCLRLHLETCELLQERDPNLTKSQRISLLCRLASSAQSLLRLQEKLFGSDHFDLARTHLEFAQAMEELLSTAPKQIVQLGLPGLNTFEACSAAEHASRTEHERIKSLYPHNVQDLIRPHRKEQD